MKTGHIHLSFPDQGRIDAADIGHYLFLFRGAYAAALPLVTEKDAKAAVAQLDHLETLLRAKLGRLDVAGIDGLFSRSLGENAPVAERITHESPLEIIMAGVYVAMTLAVVLSGGTVKFDFKEGKVEATVPPIGEGIKKLREALSKAPKARLAYGVKSKLIKLSANEFSELMKYDPSTKKRGGFQRLLIGMQYRVNRVTHELLLSDHEMDLILRHGRHPSKGGWQRSLRIMFGNHFNFPK